MTSTRRPGSPISWRDCRIIRPSGSTSSYLGFGNATTPKRPPRSRANHAGWCAVNTHLRVPRRVDTVILQSCEDVGEPGLRVDVVELGGFDQRIDGGGAPAAFVGSRERPVVTAER